MKQVKLESGVLEYEVRGAGEPVVFVHGAFIADAFAPLLAEPALTARYQLILYHRRGFAGSTKPAGPLSLTEQAADCRSLLQQLGVQQAHVVGHSYGGAIALQFALDAPDLVASLALLEPALLMVPSAPQFMAALEPVMQLYAAGTKAGAADRFLETVVSPTYRSVLDRVLPGAFTQVVADADTFFQTELPALAQWPFTQTAAGQIRQPVLSVLGADSPTRWPGWVEVHELVQAWLPQTEAFVLENATHGLQMMNPQGMAVGLARFFARHSLLKHG
jgi:pimeloyl-ACP methyl ester carboxylesterase